MDAAPNLASTYAMHLSGCVLVCLCVTSLLCVGCGPEPTAKQPDPSASVANTTGPAPSAASTTAATSNTSTASTASTTGTSAPTASAASSASSTPPVNSATSGSDTQPLVGTLTNAEIQKAVNDNLQAFDACYSLGADKQGKLEGTITMKATVNPLGKVIDVAVVKSTIKNSKVNDCVGTAFKKVVFPNPKGGVAIITYPMTFGGEVVTKKK